MRVKELAEWLELEFEGDGEIELTGVAPIELAGAGDLSFINSRKAAQQAGTSSAGCLIVRGDFVNSTKRTVIRAASPRMALARAINKLYPAEESAAGIDASAVVAPGARIGAGVSIGPHASVGEGSIIGQGTRIGAGCRIG